MPKSASKNCAADKEDSVKLEDTMAQRANFESPAVAAPGVTSRKTAESETQVSSKNQPTPDCSSTSTQNEDQTLMAESTACKVAMQQSYSPTHLHFIFVFIEKSNSHMYTRQQFQPFKVQQCVTLLKGLKLKA